MSQVFLKFSMPQKKTDKYKPLSGFPWKGKFEDMEEVRAYFASDRLQCLLCGRTYVGLGNHVLKTHGISGDDYKEQFGLPWSYGLAGKSFKEKSSATMLKTWRAGKLKKLDAAHIKKLHLYKKRKNRKVPAAVKNTFAKITLKRLGLERKWDAQDYEEFLKRIKSGRTPPEVGKDNDMPAVYLFQKFMRQNPKFRKKFKEVWDNLPFEVQSRGLRFGERIKTRIITLRMKGHSFPEIGRILGISQHTARCLWFEVKHKGTGAKRKMLENYEKNLRWGHEVYDEFMKRISSGRTAGEVAKDKDMPPRFLFDKRVRNNAQFRKRYDEIWYKLPFSVQMRGRRTGTAL